MWGEFLTPTKIMSTNQWEEDPIIFEHLHLTRVELVRVLRKHGYTRCANSYYRRHTELRTRYKDVFFSAPQMLELLRQSRTQSGDPQWRARRDALLDKIATSLPDSKEAFETTAIPLRKLARFAPTAEPISPGDSHVDHAHTQLASGDDCRD